MAVTAAQIKELRELTGAGMSDCKKALDETGGDIKKSIEFLREKGLAAAAKKAGRIAAEGLVACVVNDNKAVVVEVNCETDFVAINADFKAYVEQIAAQVIDSNASTVEEFAEEKWAADTSQTVKEVLMNKIATIGENLSIRRFERYVKETAGVIASYVHGGGKMGVLVELDCAAANDEVRELGRNLGMQIVAMSPQFIGNGDISADYIESEKAIITAAVKADEANASKPDKVIVSMVEGKLKKQLKEISLLDQEYVKEPEMTVRQYLEKVSKEIGSEIVVARFTRYEKGEGIEKKTEDFADEVAKAMIG
jgi:elongation factor Ts